MNKIKKFESQVHEQRFILGLICAILPFACLIFGVFGHITDINYEGWYESISATYFANSNMCMIGALSCCALFLFTYKGYDLGDRFWTILAGISALGVVAFPCKASPLANVGLFALPIVISNVLHYISALGVFGSFALMTLTQFTKGNKHVHNKIYKICGWIMIVFICVMFIRLLLNLPEWLTMVCEIFILESFAFAWILKSGAFSIEPSDKDFKKEQVE